MLGDRSPQFERTLAAQVTRIVIRERREPIHQPQDVQMDARRFKTIETAHALVMLIETPNDQLAGIVGAQNERTLDRIQQFWKMIFQAVEDAHDVGCPRHIRGAL
jgi:hypothetical protein